MKRNVESIKTVSFAVFTILVFITFVVSIATFVAHDSLPDNPLVSFAIHNHLWIMIIAILVSIFYGYFWAKFLTSQIKQKETDVHSMFDIVMKFLSSEEKRVLKHLIENNGETKQAEIARLKNMGRVKALRTVQKMKDKDLIDVEPHGKQRVIKLKQNVHDLLKDDIE